MRIRFFTCFIWVCVISIIIFSCGQKQDETSTIPKGTMAEGTENLQKVPVEALVLQPQNANLEIPLTGVAQPIHEVDIISEVSGKIVNIGKELGDPIISGDTLARIDDRVYFAQYRQAQAHVITAKTNLAIAQSNYKSDETLYKNGDISGLAKDNSLLAVQNAEAGLIAAEAALVMAEKSYRDTRFVSQITGLISRKSIDLGTMVNPGMMVYRIVDLSVLKIQAGVSQTFRNRIHIDDYARITIAALENRAFNGIVKHISPQADEVSGSFAVEIHAPNDHGYPIKAGMTASIRLILTSVENQVVIPDHATVRKDEKLCVYCLSQGYANLREIKTGEILNGQMIVKEGLTFGDTIVVTGMNNLGEKTPITIESIR